MITFLECNGPLKKAWNPDCLNTLGYDFGYSFAIINWLKTMVAWYIIWSICNHQTLCWYFFALSEKWVTLHHHFYKLLVDWSILVFLLFTRELRIFLYGMYFYLLSILILELRFATDKYIRMWWTYPIFTTTSIYHRFSTLDWSPWFCALRTQTSGD